MLWFVHFFLLRLENKLMTLPRTVDLPNRALSDAQVSAEYVAYLTHALALHSKTKQVSLVSHSQGGLNIQWALDFWPSLRHLVSSFVALAPDFFGTGEGPLACLVLGVAEGGCNPCTSSHSSFWSSFP